MPYFQITRATNLGITGLNRILELEKRSVHPFLLNNTTMQPEAEDIHLFNLVIGGQSDEALQQSLESQIERNDMMITLVAQFKLKTFSKFKMKDLCELYNLPYLSDIPLSPFPRFECQVEPVDENLVDDLVADLVSRLDVTPLSNASEAHQTVYTYDILLAISKPTRRKVRVMIEKYIESFIAKGRAD